VPYSVSVPVIARHSFQFPLPFRCLLAFEVFHAFNVAFSLCVHTLCLVISTKNLSSSSAITPHSNVHSDPKLFHTELSNVKQNLDDSSDYEEEEDASATPSTPIRRPYPASRHHGHYLPSVDRQTEHKYYSPHQHNSYPALVSAATPTGLLLSRCHFLLLTLACAFTSTLVLHLRSCPDYPH